LNTGEVYENRLLSKIVELRKLPLNFKVEYFGEQHEIAQFIDNYYKKYTEVPSIDAIQTNGLDFDLTVSNDSLDFYLDKVIEDYNKRRMMENIAKMVDNIENNNLEKAATLAMDINKNFTRVNTVLDYDDYDKGLVKLYDYKYKTLGKTWQLKSFKNIHNFITSFHQGEFHVIAGRPKMGKTYLALAMAMDLYKQGARVGIASAEMSEDKMIQRCDMLATELSPVYFEGGYTTRSFINKIKRTREEYKKNGGKLFFIGFEKNKDLYTGTVWDLAKELEEHKIDVLLIDSLYAYRSSTKRVSTWESTVDLVNDAVSLTRQYNTLTFVTTQFNRQANKRKGNNAKAEDVGYSDAFLQYSDSLIGLNGDKDMKQTGTRRLDVLAVREGSEGDFYINYKFQPKLQIKDIQDGYSVKSDNDEEGNYEDDGLQDFESW